MLFCVTNRQSVVARSAKRLSFLNNLTFCYLFQSLEREPVKYLTFSSAISSISSVSGFLAFWTFVQSIFSVSRRNVRNLFLDVLSILSRYLGAFSLQILPSFDASTLIFALFVLFSGFS